MVDFIHVEILVLEPAPDSRYFPTGKTIPRGTKTAKYLILLRQGFETPNPLPEKRYFPTGKSVPGVYKGVRNLSRAGTLPGNLKSNLGNMWGWL